MGYRYRRVPVAELITMFSPPPDLTTVLERLAAHFGGLASNIFLTFSGSLSIASLFSAFCVAAAFIARQRWRKHKGVRAGTLLRSIFPARIFLSRSCKADYAFVVFNVFMVGLLFGWALLSFNQVSHWVSALLTRTLGPIPPSELPEFATSLTLTIAIFLSYELGYWFDHYLSHKVPALWECHKVHHSAEVLTPLTNFRMHPVNSIIFCNITAVATGLTNGALCYAFGKTLGQFTISNSNLILVAFAYATVHLQHSHVWIPFTGWLGRIVLSPAHHQIHHSQNPIHFDRNFGGCLSLFDWIFGTLHMPAKERETLSFGVPAEGSDPHSAMGALITPLARALGHLKPRWGSAPSPEAQKA